MKMFLFYRIYDRYEMMKMVGIVLPQGLGGDVTTLKNTEWTQKHSETDHHPPADEELLLNRISKTTVSETGDTSSCISLGASGTGTGTCTISDSGSNEKESITPCTPYVLTGDVPKVQNSGYVPFSVSGTESIEKNAAGYVVAGNLQRPCDSGDGDGEGEGEGYIDGDGESDDTDQCSSFAPYVMTGDVPKVPMPNPGYVPFTTNAPEPPEKQQTGYVVAGNKSSIFIPDILQRHKSIKED